MHPSITARSDPGKLAQFMAGSGATQTFAALDAASNRGAQVWRSLGLDSGACVAIFLENHRSFLEIAWSAQRAGLVFVCVSSKLSISEVAYIVADSGARAIVASPATMPEPSLFAAAMPTGTILLTVDAAAPPFRSWAEACADQPATPIPDERAGTDMLYSSGTTGRPKGIRVPLPADPDIAAPSGMSNLMSGVFGFGADTVYLNPAPLYHAAPLRWTMTAQKLGGTAVVMERFDAEEFLALIERYRVTHLQCVPTHFVRLLKLPAPVRARYDLSSLKFAIHAAAPCPVPVKRAMLDWWGPIIWEYYTGTEGNGMAMISPGEWIARPGSVGKAVVGTFHICDEQGEPIAEAGRDGAVFVEGGNPFAYHNDSAKTDECRNARGWTTLGDIGRLDADGYLYLTDRKSFMIISGGVNIYPAEIENLLITHPQVADVAVIGGPHEEMGEEVVAVVQPVDPALAGPGLAADLIDFARAHLSHVKTPRRVDFRAALPRTDTGKLFKRLLRDEYWSNTISQDGN